MVRDNISAAPPTHADKRITFGSQRHVSDKERTWRTEVVAAFADSTTRAVCTMATGAQPFRFEWAEPETVQTKTVIFLNPLHGFNGRWPTERLHRLTNFLSGDIMPPRLE